MDNKFIRYCIVEPECRLRFAAFVALIVIIAAQLWYRDKQVRHINIFREEKALVEKIDNMKETLRMRARLKDFRKGEDIGLTDIRPAKINGFAMQKGTPSVLVDGMVYSEGSLFGEYVIVKITKEMITLVNKKTNAIKNLYVFEQ